MNNSLGGLAQFSSPSAGHLPGFFLLLLSYRSSDELGIPGTGKRAIAVDMGGEMRKKGSAERRERRGGEVKAVDGRRTSLRFFSFVW